MIKLFSALLLVLPISILAEVAVETQTVVKSSANLVLTGNYTSIIKLIEDQEHLYGEIIDATYGNDIKNFDAVMKFIHDSPESYQATGYEAIFLAMEKNGQLWSTEGFKLAYAVSQFDAEWPLAPRFPDTMYKIYFLDGNCLLKNIEFNEYYYAAVAYYAYDKYRRRNFCWGKGTYSKDSVYDVRVVTDDVFTLRNTNVDEYLYAEEALHAHSTERRRVFTFRVKTRPVGSEWKFEPQPDTQNIMKIRNTRWDELLFADRDVKYTKNRREVFTERIKGHAQERWTLWSLEC